MTDNGLAALGERRAAAKRRVERRTFPRTAVQLEANIISLGELDSPPSTGVIENISGGGVRLRTGEQYERGARLELFLPSLRGAGDDVPESIVVETVACRAADDGNFVSHCRFAVVSRATLLQIFVAAPQRKRAR
jgi:hypothetical protein